MTKMILLAKTAIFGSFFLTITDGGMDRQTVLLEMLTARTHQENCDE